ncbi:hypothetical protein J2X37_003299 [Croceicoccus sp. BE223]|nr:hypothetical protein [Croceicoccus sp. BE223]
MRRLQQQLFAVRPNRPGGCRAAPVPSAAAPVRACRFPLRQRCRRRRRSAPRRLRRFVQGGHRCRKRHGVRRDEDAALQVREPDAASPLLVAELQSLGAPFAGDFGHVGKRCQTHRFGPFENPFAAVRDQPEPPAFDPLDRRILGEEGKIATVAILAFFPAAHRRPALRFGTGGRNEVSALHRARRTRPVAFEPEADPPSPNVAKAVGSGCVTYAGRYPANSTICHVPSISTRDLIGVRPGSPGAVGGSDTGGAETSVAVQPARAKVMVQPAGKCRFIATAAHLSFRTRDCPPPI